MYFDVDGMKNPLGWFEELVVFAVINDREKSTDYDLIRYNKAALSSG
jgi:hypothetical protein